MLLRFRRRDRDGRETAKMATQYAPVARHERVNTCSIIVSTDLLLRFPARTPILCILRLFQ